MTIPALYVLTLVEVHHPRMCVCVRVTRACAVQLVNDAGTCLDHLEKVESYFADVRAACLHVACVWLAHGLRQSRRDDVV